MRRLINNILAHIRTRRLLKRMQDREIEKLETELPANYDSWITFYNDTKGHDTDYIMLLETHYVDGVCYDTGRVLDYQFMYIRQEAIKEAIENEDYELADIIKQCVI